MQEMMMAKAKELLASGAVNRVLGWKAGEFVYDITPAVFARRSWTRDLYTTTSVATTCPNI